MSRFGRVMEQLAPAVALSTALYGASVEAKPSPAEAYYIHPLTVEYETVIQNAFVRVTDFWRSQGVPLQTTLEILQGRDAVECRGVDTRHLAKAADFEEAEYCPGDDKVVISDSFVDYISFGYHADEGKTKDILEFVVAHEEGHAVQQKTVGIKPETKQTLEYHAPLEVQADCFGGMALEAKFPSDVDGASTFFHHAPVYDTAHGLPIQRYDSYYQGARTKNCPSGLMYGPFASLLAPFTD